MLRYRIFLLTILNSKPATANWTSWKRKRSTVKREKKRTKKSNLTIIISKIMSKGKIFVAGIGPGGKEDITPAVLDAIAVSDVIVGYKYYFRFVENIIKPGTPCIDTGMKKERERALQAFEYAEQD